MTEKQERLRRLLEEINGSDGAALVDGVEFGEFRKEFLAAIDVGKARRMLAGGERNGRLSGKELALIRRGKELKGRVAAAELKARIESLGEGLKELVRQKRFQELEELFEHYFNIQFSEEFIGKEECADEENFLHPVLIALDEEIFLAAVMTLLYTEHFRNACRILKIREASGQMTPELTELSEDLERFRSAVEKYENGESQEAEEVSLEMIEKYPDNPAFLKFHCRFLMGRADEKRREAERFIGECLKLFPEDGYFLKYKADLLWMNGSCRKALELYAQARKRTLDTAPLHEMDSLFQECKQEVLDTCVNLLEYKAKEEAGQLMELWQELMPEDEEVRACLCLTKVELARTQGDLELVIKEILGKIEKSMVTPLPVKGTESEAPAENKTEPWEQYYKRALTRAWIRLGYPQELAVLYTELKCTSGESDLEWLAEECRSYRIKKEMRAKACKLTGDVRMKQGQTRAAFESYREALELAKPSYTKKELVRVILDDLYQGEQRVRSWAKNSDLMPFLDGWLGKYGTLEDISKMISRLV